MVQMPGKDYDPWIISYTAYEDEDPIFTGSYDRNCPSECVLHEKKVNVFLRSGLKVHTWETTND